MMKGLPVSSAQATRNVYAGFCISEVTLAELKYGIAKSERRISNAENLRRFMTKVEVLPISPVIDTFAEEKARLARAGTIIPDFDLLIGVTAVHHGLTMVTNNTKHSQRIKGIQLEDWTR